MRYKFVKVYLRNREKHLLNPIYVCPCIIFYVMYMPDWKINYKTKSSTNYEEHSQFQIIGPHSFPFYFPLNYEFTMK